MLPSTPTSRLHCHLPQETLENIIDHLHDDQETLKECCLASKSFVIRARKHIFAFVHFGTQSDLEAWKKTFPDPSNSPAHYTRDLVIGCPEFVTAADAAEGGWIPTFSSLVHLELDNGLTFFHDYPMSLAPFREFPPTLKSLFVHTFCLSCPQVFNLICSFPLLEDLILVGSTVNTDDHETDEPPTLASSPTSPALTGFLDIVTEELSDIVRPLLALPNGLRFRTLHLSWFWEQELHSVVELIEACSDTLESLRIMCVIDEAAPDPIDLSKATKLRDVEFCCRALDGGCDWIIMALQTVTSQHRHLRQISIDIPWIREFASDDLAIQAIEDGGHGMQWSDLDRLLVQLMESHSIYLVVSCSGTTDGAGLGDVWAKHLFPESTKKQISDSRSRSRRGHQ